MWKYKAVESWNCGAQGLASCNLFALLASLETESRVKNYEPFTLEVDALLWIILLILCPLNKLKQPYCVLHLLRIALVISLLMNQAKSLTSLEP